MKRSFSKSLIKSRRGFAMESALVFLLTVFALCALVTTLTLVGHNQSEFENSTVVSKVELEQIGEDFLAWRRDNPQSENTQDTFSGESENYAYKSEGNLLTVWSKSNTAMVLLRVRLELEEGENGKWQIAEWSTLPTKK